MQESNVDLYVPALESLRSLIRASTTSMTSVPKPLKFMRIHYPAMKEIYKKLTDNKTRQLCADILSVLAMTMGTGKECLVYRFLCDPKDQIGEWGHEYVRHLSGEIAVHWNETSSNFKTRLINLVHQIVPYNLAHNAEAEACDLLMEIERLDFLEQYVDESNYERVCLYLQGCVAYVPEPENTNLLKAAVTLSRKFEKHANAMRLALMLNDMSLIEEVFHGCKDLYVHPYLGHHGFY